MGKSKNGLPDRWLAYKAIGMEIRGVPIIACKVPLKEEILRNRLQQDQWFTPDILVEMVPNVGCIVDLTATNRYYNPSVFTERGIHHAKILCEGHVIPKPATVKTFFQVVDEFLHSIHSRGKVLMVHCTHGLNRTGYLVSRYMVERRGFQPKDAIQAFNSARGHGIERTNYLNDLHQRSQSVCPNPLPLFQKRGPYHGFVDQAAAAAGFERSNSPNDYNLQDGLSGLHNQPPPLLLDHHRHFPPPVSHSSKERPSSVTQPSERRPKGPRKGRKNKRQGTSASNNNSPMPSDVPEVPSVPMQPPPTLPAIKKLPNLKWVVVGNPPAPLINCNDRSSSRRRSKIKRQLVSVPLVPNTPPANAGPQKPKPNKSNPPSVAPKSDCQDRNQKRKCIQLDSSIEILSTSSVEICYDSRKAEPSGQQNSKVHPVPGRQRNRAQQPQRNGTSSSASRQELPPPDLPASGKKKRSRGRKGGAGGAGRLNEASNPSAERT